MVAVANAAAAASSHGGGLRKTMETTSTKLVGGVGPSGFKRGFGDEESEAAQDHSNTPDIMLYVYY